MDTEEFIEHHGIKGQKWGVRRYQNSDGTLTAAGKKRYAKGAYQGKMNDDQRHEYAKYRVQSVGANKAVNQEVFEFAKNYVLRSIGTGAASSAIAAGSAYAGMCGALPLSVVGGGVASGLAFYNAYKAVQGGVRAYKNGVAIGAASQK